MSMSQLPLGKRQQVRIPPTSTRFSSRPGGSGAGISTFPLMSLTRQVPQFPEVQFVGILTPARLAISTNGASLGALAEPIISDPRKNLTNG